MNQEEIDEMFDQQRVFRFFITNVESIKFDQKEMKKLSHKEREKVKQLEISISLQGMQMFPLIKWNNLQIISLASSQFNNISCKYLSRASLKSIQKIILDWNEIGDDGVKHLSKGQWSTLQVISLKNNFLKSDCISWLIRANWKSLTTINGRYNSLIPHKVIQFALMQSQSIGVIQFHGKNAVRCRELVPLKQKFNFNVSC